VRARSHRTQEVREPRCLQLVDADGAFDFSRLVPDAQTDVGILVEVTRNAQGLARVARVGRKELDELAP
jgi:hypothetical protein